MQWISVEDELPKSRSGVRSKRYLTYSRGFKTIGSARYLRVVSNRQNRLNSRRPNTNKSGVTGVYLRTESTSWRAQIYNNGKKVILGDTPDFFEAVCMRKSAERSLGYHLNHDKI